MKKCTLVVLLGLCSLFTLQSLAQDATTTISNYLSQQKENHGLTSQDIEFEITNQNVSKVSGITHVYYRQLVNGIPVYGSESSAHIMPDGTLLKMNNGFVSQSIDKSSGMTSPGLSADGAIAAAANALGYTPTKSFSIVEDLSEGSPKMLMSDGGISLLEIPVALTYQKSEEGDITLAWDLSILEIGQQNWWSVRVDASTGQIIDRVNWMVSCEFEHDHADHDHSGHDHGANFNLNLQPAVDKSAADAGGCVECYEVFALPLESPFFGDRTFEVNPADPTASPFGWHDTNGVAGAEFTTTRGNNANAYEDGDNVGFQPDGGSDLFFGGVGFEWDIAYSPANQYEAAAVTNLFYWTNIIHDVLYQYGFDEAGGNFQENNYGGGGIGGDSVDSEAQDGSGTCNANFGTPPDGGNPRMQMYTCGSRDGDYDNLVIIHEYGHGISNRLTGGPGAAGCLGNSEQMGEGWSDWYGLVMTMEPGDAGVDPRGVGTYLFNEGPDGAGIRPFPYSTDMNINPQTYDFIQSSAIPHGVGSVWAMMLWEMTWGLIDANGWDADIYNFTGDASLDAGNVMAIALVTEAMKLQPCSPGFVDGRDAILAADVAIYGGANECIIWDAFAKRGLGINAIQGSSFSVADGTENFDTPSGEANFTAPSDVCSTEEAFEVTGAGSPIGGVYSGPGVTDNGDGLTYTFDPAVAGVGVHTITYEIGDSACASASVATDDIEVLATPDSPLTTGVTDVCIGDEVTVTATLSDPANNIRWFDAEVGGAFLFEGTDYTFTPTGSVDLWAEETADDFLSKLVISEVTLETPDRFEIQNVGVQTDYTGYRVVVSEEPFSNINTVNPVVQTLGVMDEDEAIAWNDTAGDADYWGSNLWWDNDAPDSGWILILDPSGNVVDSAFWNVDSATLATFDINVAGFNITAADLDWVGSGAALTANCNDSFQRNGDSDSALDWPNTCLEASYGEPNENIGIGFAGCVAPRTLTQVIAEDIAPEITCPEDEVYVIEDGLPYVVPDYSLSATFSDNCPEDPTITQDPAVGAELGPGDYTVTLTATDAAGNSSDCTFTLTVEGVLSVDEFGIDNVITLYPNPSQGDLTLRNRSTAIVEDVNLYDVNGRLIKRLNVQGVGAEIQFNLNDVASGLYFVQIITDQGQTVKRVVKQ
ncbi:M36 family metallopeptidase [Gilvibacter sp.]|uniref:M36 family metallopeptidase n=1 Tax=Gilvibacter sp. TaxID=2729997 RepID=UPI0025B9A437|nr:M36 family metallopeptidase [Gilvibacter sp.]NQX78269.1 T9SS type A sorting domain-containing protein [Gilvibacter sp.]